MNDGSSAPSPAAPPAAPPVRAPERPAQLSSVELLRGQRLVEIAHNGEIYRLQATRQGKLILTK
ncbi:hemin uptake protein HemP [Ramlibacter sp. AN1133]|uniref:hemin uptake protein HemP n=1 Tax=Ramlibacter sp. AN1133 TaxID=3133429 RepID=UPI0030C4575F